jgi:Asp-tRNA(Asn)/Glu-tRNA(Gln) amidotransferase A subunit family amidase
MARSVRDLAIVLRAIAGFDPDDPHTKDVPVPDYVAALTGNIHGLRIGVPRNYFFEDVQASVQEAVAVAIRTLESLGANAVPVTIAGLDDVLDCFFPLVMSEASTYHQKTLRLSPDLFGEDVRLFLEAGELMLATTYITAQRARSMFKASFQEALRNVDVLVTPAQPMTAPKVGQTLCRFGDREESLFAASARFCAPFNLSGLPAASVPCGFAPDGLPIGLQIVGKPFDEATVLRVADAFERHTDWHLRHPAIG